MDQWYYFEDAGGWDFSILSLGYTYSRNTGSYWAVSIPFTLLMKEFNYLNINLINCNLTGC